VTRMTLSDVLAHQNRVKGIGPGLGHFASVAPVAKKSKFSNKRVDLNGETFDSKLEARRYQALELMEKAGEIRDLKHHVKFPLMVGDEMIGYYEADAVYFDCIKNCKVVEDAKGTRTPVFIWKARHFKAQYGYAITEVRSA
jgi:hypothetical protein